MTPDHLRDAAGTVAVCSFFASIWFGWAQDRPPRPWRLPLALAAVGSVLLAVLGGILTWQWWSDGTAFDRDTSQAFGSVVAIEIAVAGVGAALLNRTGRGALTPAWIALVVGIHFVPLGMLLDSLLLHVVAIGVVVVAATAAPVARSRDLELSAVTGVGTGSVLLATALFLPHDRRPMTHPDRPAIQGRQSNAPGVGLLADPSGDRSGRPRIAALRRTTGCLLGSSRPERTRPAGSPGCSAVRQRGRGGWRQSRRRRRA